MDDQVNGNMKYGRVRVVEKLGMSLINSLGNQAPWRGDHCGCADCWPCQAKEGSCKLHNIRYSIRCIALSFFDMQVAPVTQKAKKEALGIKESKRVF